MTGATLTVYKRVVAGSRGSVTGWLLGGSNTIYISSSLASLYNAVPAALDYSDNEKLRQKTFDRLVSSCDLLLEILTFIATGSVR